MEKPPSPFGMRFLHSAVLRTAPPRIKSGVRRNDDGGGSPTRGLTGVDGPAVIGAARLANGSKGQMGTSLLSGLPPVPGIGPLAG